MIDLHVHSRFSDGLCTPEALVERASETALSALALTDHDTLAGVPRFLAAAAAAGLRAVSGLELSVDYGETTVHLLGYGCDPGDAGLQSALVRVREGRHRRNVEILSRLSRLGCAITWPDVLARAGDPTVVGRPHFAAVLAAKGYARGHRDAFTRYLGRGAPAYVERDRLEPEAAIARIRGAGGVAVLAHPGLCGLSDDSLREFVRRLADGGLGGLEAWHPSHGRRQVELFVALAASLGLITTGGSDFHGATATDATPGFGAGVPAVPDACFDALLARMGES